MVEKMERNVQRRHQCQEMFGCLNIFNQPRPHYPGLPITNYMKFLHSKVVYCHTWASLQKSLKPFWIITMANPKIPILLVVMSQGWIGLFVFVGLIGKKMPNWMLMLGLFFLQLLWTAQRPRCKFTTSLSWKLPFILNFHLMPRLYCSRGRIESHWIIRLEQNIKQLSFKLLQNFSN